MNLMKKIVLSCIALIIILGGSGCMKTNNAENNAENMKSIALEYLQKAYPKDDFKPKGFTPSSWAYEYASVTFTSSNYNDSVIEVRVYKNNDDLFSCKDNYYQCVMKEEAEKHFAKKMENNSLITVKVRFPNSVWSDELTKFDTFDDWILSGKCYLDVFYITNEIISDNDMDNILNKIASEKIYGTISFMTASIEGLDKTNLDDILNNQNTMVSSNIQFTISSDYKISKK